MITPLMKKHLSRTASACVVADGGVVKALAGEPGDIIKVGGVLAVIETESEERAATAEKSSEAAPTVAPALSKSKGNGRAKRVLASPATRKLALERGVDLAVLGQASARAPAAVRDAIGDGPIERGAVGTGLAAGNESWKIHCRRESQSSPI